MASTRVLGTCRGVRVPHLLPDKWNLNTADQRVSLSGYSACGGPVYWCWCRRTRCSGQPSVKTQTREYVARISHRSVDVRHPLKMQTSATVYKRKEKLVLCLSISVGRGAGSYPVGRQFESVLRHHFTARAHFSVVCLSRHNFKSQLQLVSLSVWKFDFSRNSWYNIYTKMRDKSKCACSSIG